MTGGCLAGLVRRAAEGHVIADAVQERVPEPLHQPGLERRLLRIPGADSGDQGDQAIALQVVGVVEPAAGGGGARRSAMARTKGL
jgi:hypothetical protein